MENSSELKEKPLVTIITALYNKNTDNWLDTYAESLARQTFLDKMQIIIIDNCSTDGGYEKIQQLIEKFSLPAKLYQNETNIGPAGSGKKLLKMIDTEFWAVLDPDDYYLSPRKVEKAVTFLQAHEDYSAYACNEVKLDPNGQNSTAHPSNIPNQTFEKRKGSLFFQAASTTFRNFFTSNLMDSLFKKMGGEIVLSWRCT